MCDALLRGAGLVRGINQVASNQDIVFFSKGSYPIHYTGYAVTSWAFEANNTETKNTK